MTLERIKGICVEIIKKIYDVEDYYENIDKLINEVATEKKLDITSLGKSEHNKIRHHTIKLIWEDWQREGNEPVDDIKKSTKDYIFMFAGAEVGRFNKKLPDITNESAGEDTINKDQYVNSEFLPK